MTLHERIAAALGWTVPQTQSFSLAALRDLVRPVNPQLAAEISDTISGGGHIRGPVKKMPKLPTFKVAREHIQAALKAAGWALSPALNPQMKPYKVPFATSPGGDVRLWFKTEAIYVSWHGRNGSSLADARSLESDMRTLDPVRFAEKAESIARRYLAGG